MHLLTKVFSQYQLIQQLFLLKKALNCTGICGWYSVWIHLGRLAVFSNHVAVVDHFLLVNKIYPMLICSSSRVLVEVVDVGV